MRVTRDAKGFSETPHKRLLYLLGASKTWLEMLADFSDLMIGHSMECRATICEPSAALAGNRPRG